MNAALLPVGQEIKPPPTPHFPTQQQALIWRNWGLVPAARLARILRTSSLRVRAGAAEMGLDPKVHPSKRWMRDGYATIIRANWHLLPYDQLLDLLGWTPERMLAVLHEEDFLWVKLGRGKPVTETIRYRALSRDERERTLLLREDLQRYDQPIKRRRTEEPFAFLGRWQGSSAVPARDQRDPRVPLRLAYSYFASCGDALLDPAHDPYPDRMLAAYAATGVNAVWLHGILYQLCEWESFPGLSQGRESRLSALRRLVRRAARHGIGIYLYLNEPRGLPEAAFSMRPDLRGTRFAGSDLVGLCTSNPEVRAFLRHASEEVFREVPGLAGVLTITMSENPTNCHSRRFPEKECPLCAHRGEAEVVAEVNRLIAEGVHAADPRARVVVWTWGWQPQWDLDAVDRLPTDVDLMCVSEWGLPTAIGGVPGTVIDYSISQIGPSQQSLRLWKRAQERGLRTMAKVQMNSSWELCALPWLPVCDLVAEHLRRLEKEGISNLMIGWTLGGYPGGNLELLKRPPSALADHLFGLAAPAVRRAWSAFSKAFAQLPFSCETIYLAPVNLGPANLLHPVASGLHASMVIGFPYDDLTAWRAQYPEEIFEEQWRRVATGWAAGLRYLAQAKASGRMRKNIIELEGIAIAAHCHFRSTWLQIRFIHLRDSVAPGSKRNRAMRFVIREELALAQTLLGLVRRDSRIGFEAANHYLYTEASLREKIIQCAYLLRKMH